MTDQLLPSKFPERAVLTIPRFGSRPSVELLITNIKIAENRIIEAKVVNSATYNELEHVFNEGYREAKQHITVVGYEITQAKRVLRKVKQEALLDEYKDCLKEKGLKDSAAIRDAFLETKEDYSNALDRLDMLNAIESLFEGKIKVFENVCRYMRKSVDISNRSGFSGNHYVK